MPFLTEIVHMNEKPIHLLNKMIIILEILLNIFLNVYIILLCDNFKHFGWKKSAYSAKHYLLILFVITNLL